MKTKSGKKESSSDQREELLSVLKTRFEKNPGRHKGLNWADIQAKLESNPKKIASLTEMENTGGQPDVIGQDKKSSEFLFVDCGPRRPEGRYSLCYDREALDSRKEFKPKN